MFIFQHIETRLEITYNPKILYNIMIMKGNMVIYTTHTNRTLGWSGLICLSLCPGWIRVWVCRQQIYNGGQCGEESWMIQKYNTSLTIKPSLIIYHTLILWLSSSTMLYPRLTREKINRFTQCFWHNRKTELVQTI